MNMPHADDYKTAPSDDGLSANEAADHELFTALIDAVQAKPDHVRALLREFMRLTRLHVNTSPTRRMASAIAARIRRDMIEACARIVSVTPVLKNQEQALDRLRQHARTTRRRADRIERDYTEAQRRCDSRATRWSQADAPVQPPHGPDGHGIRSQPPAAASIDLLSAGLRVAELHGANSALDVAVPVLEELVKGLDDILRGDARTIQKIVRYLVRHLYPFTQVRHLWPCLGSD